MLAICKYVIQFLCLYNLPFINFYILYFNVYVFVINHVYLLNANVYINVRLFPCWSRTQQWKPKLMDWFELTAMFCSNTFSSVWHISLYTYTHHLYLIYIVYIHAHWVLNSLEITSRIFYVEVYTALLYNTYMFVCLSY